MLYIKPKLIIISLLALLASCGRDEMKEDIALPELPPPASKIKVEEPNSLRTYESGKVLYIKWTGLSLADTVSMDLYKTDVYIAPLQSRPGVDNTTCKIPDSLTTSSHYKVKVYKKSDPAVFGFSEEFIIQGLPERNPSSSRL